MQSPYFPARLKKDAIWSWRFLNILNYLMSANLVKPTQSNPGSNNFCLAPFRKWIIATRPKVEPMSVNVPVTWVVRTWLATEDPRKSVNNRINMNQLDVHHVYVLFLACHWTSRGPLTLRKTSSNHQPHQELCRKSLGPRTTAPKFEVHMAFLAHTSHQTVLLQFHWSPEHKLFPSAFIIVHQSNLQGKALQQLLS